jgi:hypothetical protein
MVPSVKIRFGHALGARRHGRDIEGLRAALEVAAGLAHITPRPPKKRGVLAAEAAIGYTASNRPNYAYFAILSPHMGRTGLILKHAWFLRTASSACPFDSGGFWDRRGVFAGVPVHGHRATRGAKLKAHVLTMTSRRLLSAFLKFLSTGWPHLSLPEALMRYQDGEEPHPQCHAAAVGGALQKSRLRKLRHLAWSWELHGGIIERRDVHSVVLSPNSMEWYEMLSVQPELYGEAAIPTAQAYRFRITESPIVKRPNGLRFDNPAVGNMLRGEKL